MSQHKAKKFEFVVYGDTLEGTNLRRTRQVIIIATSLEAAMEILVDKKEVLASNRYTVTESCVL